MNRLRFEDFPQGEIIEYGGASVSAEDIVAFARQFDPQPFHLDAEAAIPVAGGLIASGWQAMALLQRMNGEAFLRQADAVGDSGVDSVAWRRPVRPGDRLKVRRTTLAAEPAVDDPGLGEATFRFELIDGAGEVLMVQESRLRLRRREPRHGR